MPDLNDLISDIGNKILEVAKGELKEDWDKLSKEDRDKFEKCSLRIAQLTFEGLQGKDIKDDLAWVKFKLSSLVHLKANRTHEVMLESVQKVLGFTFKLILATLAV